MCSVDESDEKRQRTIKIGSNNLFEVGCCIFVVCFLYCFHVLKQNRLEMGMLLKAKVLLVLYNVFSAVVSSNTIVGNGCIVGAAAKIPPNQIVLDDTIVWGSTNMKAQISNREVMSTT